jgi:membrane protease YdiL (CAAX protease family)
MQIGAAILIGVAVLLAGNLPWAALAGLNLRLWVAFPWAIVLMTAYLAAYWRFLSGAWGDGTSAATRRSSLRANGLRAPIWAASLGTGLVGFAALLVLLSIAARLVPLPPSSPIVMPPAMPVVTAFLLLAMQSVVAGVTEEAAFRGYMQSIIERRHGVVLAILINGVVFGLLHFSNHPADVLVMLPYYIAVSAIYGGLTWAADSILPALVLHSIGDVAVLTRWWRTGLPEWQLAAKPSAMVWDTGIDSSFVLAMLLAGALAAVTVWGCSVVRRMRRSTVASRERGDGSGLFSIS